MSKHLSGETRATLLAAIAKRPMSPTEISAVIGESPSRITKWLERRRLEQLDVHVFDWRQIEGTNAGEALWKFGAGENAPFPRSKFQREHARRLTAIKRAADVARRRAAVSKRPQRDPLVAALFGPYGGAQRPSETGGSL
jgi:hypothetical protein